jgi:alpha-mannosidase
LIKLLIRRYGTHISWDGDGGAVQDNPERHDYNLDEMVDQFIRSALGQQNITKTNHQMWPAGSDFQYQNADHWFHNLDKIIHYVNINATNGGPVRAFYSTPSHYTDAVKKVTADKKMTWEVRSDDIFPLADDDHEYWSGYFTSRPALKRQVRFASNFLNAARQIEIFSGVTAAEVDQATVRPSPPVGSSWTDSFEGTIGVATHHDGMSGTERQSVADDYEQRISESHFEVETGVAMALKKMSGYSGELGHCNCNAAGNCLNMSVCAFTTNTDAFTVVAWNPQGQSGSPWLRLPVIGADWAVTDVATGANIPIQTAPLDNRTLELPLLYVNHFGLNKVQDNAAKAAVANTATHILTFLASLPAVGYSTFSVKKTAFSGGKHESKQLADVPASISNGMYELTIDATTNSISKITNLQSKVSTAFDITWGYYESSEGGCSYMTNGTSLGCNRQASGAYMFRPINQTTVNFGKPTIEVTQGPLVTEIKQTFAEWATHVVRLKNNSAHIEVEWTAGPIPINNGSVLPPLPAPGGCVGWMQTQNCDSHGPLDPTNNKPCTAALSSNGESGYCQCAHGIKVYGSGCGAPTGMKTCNEACNQPIPQSPPDIGKELVVKFSSGIASKGVFYTDSNGREMAKRVRDARGPSYPPFHINEPVAENYYPVNSMLSLDDGSVELAVITDVSMGGSSMADGELEMMVHRRVLADDSRGVQEPLNETMCGCNDINAAPGQMGTQCSFLIKSLLLEACY